MRKKGFLVSGLLVLASLIGFVPSPVWASTAYVQNVWGSGSNLSGLVVTPTVTANNLLITQLFCQDGSDDATTGVSDTQSNTWHLANQTNGFVQANQANTQFTRVNVWWAVATASGADTVTTSCTATVGSLWENVYEFSGQGTTTVNSERCGTTTGTTFLTSTPCNAGNKAAFTSNYIAVAAVFCSSCNADMTAGANFIAKNKGQANSEYSVTGLASPTDFPATGANSYWVDFGLALSGAEPVVTAYKVIPCTWYQLQCWWYPMVFFGVYAGIFMFMGGAGKVSPRGLTYLLLTGLTFASLTMVLMDMITVMIPLMLTGLTTLFAVRTR